MPSKLPSSAGGLSALIIRHLVDIMAGKCSITHDFIEDHLEDPELCEILTGLLYVHEDLELRDRKIAQRTAERDRTLRELWAEMDLARKIQTVLLPEVGTLDGYQVAATMKPALEVGGDYYDVVPSDDGIWVLIGDVSGHGLTAGLTMMMVQTAARTLISSGHARRGRTSPSELLTLLNSTLRENLNRIGGKQFVTLTACHLDGDDVTYAGLHQDIVVYRGKRRSLEVIETQGTWIGLADDVSQSLTDGRFRLERGDTMLLYTDGLTEALRDGVMVGADAVADAFGRLAADHASPHAILRGIEDSVTDCTFDDDMSLIVVQRD